MYIDADEDIIVVITKYRRITTNNLTSDFQSALSATALNVAENINCKY
jgi:hypothetical protein